MATLVELALILFFNFIAAVCLVTGALVIIVLICWFICKKYGIMKECHTDVQLVGHESYPTTASRNEAQAGAGRKRKKLKRKRQVNTNTRQPEENDERLC